MLRFQQMLQKIIVAVIVFVPINSCVTQTVASNATNHNDQDLVRTVSSRLRALHEPFDASKSQFASEKCHRDMSTYLTSLKNLEIWALRMYDASAKMPSGILSGNINQLGDFDECMRSVYDNNQERIEPQYCLAYLQPEITEEISVLKHYQRMVQLGNLFSSNFNDTGHIFPRMSTIYWAICVPASCTYKDVEQGLLSIADNLTNGTGIQLKVRVDKEMCQRPSYNTITRGVKLTLALIATVFIISIFSTIYDFKTEVQNPWFVVFSLRKNTKLLCSLERNDNDLHCIHGIRCLFMVLVVFMHKLVCICYIPHINRNDISQMLDQPFSLFWQSGMIYTDPFLMISGLLATYSLTGRLQRGKEMLAIRNFILRFTRIMIPFLFTIYLCIFLEPIVGAGSGPLFNLTVITHLELCKNSWWKSLFIIPNYFGVENMCFGHSHHIATDTQLFVFVPLMSLLLWKYPKAGTAALIGIAGFSTIGRYLITIHKRLTMFLNYGISIKSIYDSFNYIHLNPAYRITPFIMGVLLGYLLRTKKDFKLSHVQLRLGWFINILFLIAAIVGPDPMNNHKSYIYNSTREALYAAYAPIALCSFFGWIIFTSQLGYASILSRIFSWRGFLVTTRLSYAIYLNQIPMFFSNVGKVRHSGYFSLATGIFNFYEMLTIVLVSIVTTLSYETPLENIYQILYPTKLRDVSPKLADRMKQPVDSKKD